MSRVLVVDTSSILGFNKFYIFDKNSSSEVYSKLTNFLMERIKAEEIIILDKVFGEINENKYTKDLKKAIKDFCVNSLFLFNEVQDLISKYTRHEIIDEFNFSDSEVEKVLSEYENKFADLYLIAYCKYFQSQGKNPILITEETFSDDNKVIEKIPKICKGEGIEFQKIPHVLFEIYKNELEFSLNINF